MGSRTYAFDANMVLADGAAAATATGVTTVGGAASVIDLGGDQSRTPALRARIDAMAVIMVQSVVVTTGCVYTLAIQGSNDAAFGTGNVQNLAMIDFGITGTRNGTAMTTAAPLGSANFGQEPSGTMYELGFTNEQNDVMYQYIRAYLTVAGSNASIQFTIFVAVLPEP